MTTKQWVILASAMLGLGLLSWVTLGRSEGLLAGLLALLPAGRRLLEARRLEGARTQAEHDAAKARRERETVADLLKQIEADAKRKEAAIVAEFRERMGRPPTPTEETEMLRRFRRGER